MTNKGWYEAYNGKPLYRKKGNGDLWLRAARDGSWIISRTKGKDANGLGGLARTFDAHPGPLQAKRWQVHVGRGEWEDQAFDVQVAPSPKAAEAADMAKAERSRDARESELWDDLFDLGPTTPPARTGNLGAGASNRGAKSPFGSTVKAEPSQDTAPSADLLAVLPTPPSTVAPATHPHDEYEEEGGIPGTGSHFPEPPAPPSLDNLEEFRDWIARPHHAPGKAELQVSPIAIDSQSLEPKSFPIAQVDVVDLCSNCSVFLPDQEILTCHRCKNVHYCSRACQREHWLNGHKESCSVMAGQNPQDQDQKHDPKHQQGQEDAKDLDRDAIGILSSLGGVDQFQLKSTTGTRDELKDFISAALRNEISPPLLPPSPRYSEVYNDARYNLPIPALTREQMQEAERLARGDQFMRTPGRNTSRGEGSHQLGVTWKALQEKPQAPHHPPDGPDWGFFDNRDVEGASDRLTQQQQQQRFEAERLARRYQRKENQTRGSSLWS